MLTVILECRNQETELSQTLSVLVTAAVEGLVSDVVVLDRGSRDGSAHVADAAGCRFHGEWDLRQVLVEARGEWLLLLEPGARPQAGWIEEVVEHIAVSDQPARFSPSRTYRLPFFRRLARAAPPLEHGLLLPKQQAMALAQSGTGLATLAKGPKATRLASEVIPAWVAASAR